MGEGPISNNMLGMWKATPRRRDTSMNFSHIKLTFFCASPFLAETVLPAVCHRTACSAISQREFSLSISLSLIWRETKMPQNTGTAPARHKMALTHRLGRTQQEKHWKATGTGNLTEESGSRERKEGTTSHLCCPPAVFTQLSSAFNKGCGLQAITTARQGCLLYSNLCWGLPFWELETALGLLTQFGGDQPATATWLV